MILNWDSFYLFRFYTQKRVGKPIALPKIGSFESNSSANNNSTVVSIKSLDNSNNNVMNKNPDQNNSGSNHINNNPLSPNDYAVTEL